MPALISFENYADRSWSNITTTPGAVAGLPASNLRVPLCEAMWRGATAVEEFTINWEQGGEANDYPDPTDLVALLGVNWGIGWAAQVWAWESTLGDRLNLTINPFSGLASSYPGRIPRNIIVPLPARVTARYWRITVGLTSQTVQPEARRLWSGPALRLDALKAPWSLSYMDSGKIVETEAGSLGRRRGRPYQSRKWEATLVPGAEVFGTPEQTRCLNRYMYDQGPYGECIIVPRTTAWDAQVTSVYGLHPEGIEVSGGRGNRFTVGGALREIHVPIASYPA